MYRREALSALGTTDVLDVFDAMTQATLPQALADQGEEDE
jgi:hypothetical protein